MTLINRVIGWAFDDRFRMHTLVCHYIASSWDMVFRPNAVDVLNLSIATTKSVDVTNHWMQLHDTEF